MAARTLVAGGTGFLGAAFVHELARRGHAVAVLSRKPESVGRRFPSLDVEARGGDVRNPDSLPSALAGCEAVVQCVQFPGFPVEAPSRGRTFMEVDGRGTENLARAASQAGVRKIVYLSGVGADSEADEPWYRAKAVAERAVWESGMRGVVVRPSWVYGPEDDSLNRFAAIIRGVPLVFTQLGPGDQRINPVFVEDVARLVVGALEGRSADGRVIEIGGPTIFTMDGIIRIVMEALGRRKRILHIPMEVALFGGGLLELLPGQLLSRDAVRFVSQEAVADNTALRECFPSLDLTPMTEALGTYMEA